MLLDPVGTSGGFARMIGEGVDLRPPELIYGLDDGERVKGAGMEFTAIHTPGHTPGSACFLWESELTLFSGDAVGGFGSRVNGYPLYTSAPDYRHSLERLVDVPVRHMLQAHRYRWSGADNSADRHSGDVRRTLEDSLHVWHVLDDAVRTSLSKNPEASFKELFPTVLRLAGPELGNDPEPEGVPSGALATTGMT